MSVCPACNGIIGRDCWNPQECQQITDQMQQSEAPAEQAGGGVTVHLSPMGPDQVARIREIGDWEARSKARAELESAISRARIIRAFDVQLPIKSAEAILAALQPAPAEPDSILATGAGEVEAAAWLTAGGDVTRSHAFAVEQSVNDPENYPIPLYPALPEPVAGSTLATAPHCQLCGGNVEGWVCQTCEGEFIEIEGLLILKSDNPPATILARLATLEGKRKADGDLLKAADIALANVTAFEDDARYIMGNTNFEITKHARDQIRARLQSRGDAL